MRILFLGDVFGRSGRDAVKKHLPELKEKLRSDVVICNVDNAANGRGVTKDTANELMEAGADCLTGGDHIWDQREMICVVENKTNILRAANLPSHTPGKGVWEMNTAGGAKIVVIHLCGTVFMKHHFDAPFDAADEILKNIKIGNGCSVFVDFHAEATSEKMALGQYLNGRVSAVVGTHTHIPTADAQILTNSTAYQTDAGMCGDYDSVIGVKSDVPIGRFTRKIAVDRMSLADGEATLCGTFVETDDKTGLAVNICPIRIGGRLQQILPEF